MDREPTFAESGAAAVERSEVKRIELNLFLLKQR